MNRIKFIILFISISLFYTPDFLAILNGYHHIELAQDWDSMSMLVWGYEYDSGGQIFKDFWYPYAGSIIFSGRSLQAILYLYFYKVTIFFLFGILLYKIFNNNRLLTLLVLFLIIGGENYITNNGIPLFWGLNRYILSISLVLSYILLINSMNDNNYRYYCVIFNLIFVIGLFTYFDQVMLSAVPIIAVLILFLVLNRNRIKLKYIIKMHFISIAIILLFIIILAINGQLINSIDFYYNIANNNVASTEPTTIVFSIKNILNYHTIIIIIPAFFLGLSLYSFNVNGNNRNNLIFSYIYFGLSILTLMVLMKYSIRDMRYQLMIYPIILSYFYIYNSTNYRIVVSSILIGFIIFYFPNYFNNTYNTLIKTIPGVIEKNINNIELLRDLSNTPLVERYKFNNANQKQGGEIFEIIGDNKFYVFGEPSGLYIMGKIRIPYFTSFYDGSSLKNQKRVIDSIDDKSIDYIIIRKNFTSFDLVDNTVRVPLIFDHIIQNFIYFKSTDNYYILKRNISKVVISYDFWNTYLGPNINLGYLPEKTKVSNINCDLSPSCAKYIHIVKKDSKDGNFNIELLNKSIKNNITFAMHGKDKNAYININRLWSSNFFESSLADLKIICLDKRIECSFINANFDLNKLY